MSEASESQLSVVKESAWGTTPSNPPFQKVRFTGEDLVYDIQNVVSEEIRRDADVSDLIQVGAGASGGANFELSYGDDTEMLMEAALRGTFDSVGVLRAGTEKSSFTIEKLLETGATDQYMRYTGCRINTFGLSIKEQQIVGSQLAVMGKGHTVTTSPVSGASYNASNTNPVMAAPDVGSITVANVAGTLVYTDLSFSLTNNCRVRNGLGTLDAVGIAYGRRQITGSMTAYFDDADLYNEYVSGAAGALSFTISDGSNTYTFTFPKIKYVTGRVVVAGNNQDIYAEMTWQALFDPISGCAMQVEK